MEALNQSTQIFNYKVLPPPLLKVVNDPPPLEDMDLVRGWKCEVQAIECSVDKYLYENPNKKQVDLADALNIRKCLLTKILREQAAMPIGLLGKFMRLTNSPAILQWHAWNNGFVLKTKEKDSEQKAEIKRLRLENQQLKAKQGRQNN